VTKAVQVDVKWRNGSPWYRVAAPHHVVADQSAHLVAAQV